MRSRKVLVGLVVVMLAVAGCGASSSPARSAASSPAPTATITPPLIPTAMATKMATAVPTTQGVTFAACNPQVNATANRDGDLYVSDATLTGLSYPSYQVPDNTPLKPLQVSPNSQTPFGRQADTNPNLSPHSGGYQIIICNGAKSQSHAIESVSARVGAFTAYGGQLNVWNVSDTPQGLQPYGFSVHRPHQRRDSPKALSAP